MAHLYAGTSGFAYPNWKPGFYPADLPQRRFLEHYAGRLNAVEINYTFHRLPAAATLQSWVQATPASFVFAPKAHMKITHALRLGNAGDFTAAFFRALEPLSGARRLGPVLFQLPPQMRADAQTLAEFLPLVPRAVRCAFEFRHESWFDEETFSVLRSHNAALCLAESEKLEAPAVLTADFSYFRLRKPDYAEADLDEIQRRAEELVSGGSDVYAFFKHEETPQGALWAERILRPREFAVSGKR
jgi:uncharacterized protein YecE (DUF72 family)